MAALTRRNAVSIGVASDMAAAVKDERNALVERRAPEGACRAAEEGSEARRCKGDTASEPRPGTASAPPSSSSPSLEALSGSILNGIVAPARLAAAAAACDAVGAVWVAGIIDAPLAPALLVTAPTALAPALEAFAPARPAAAEPPTLIFEWEGVSGLLIIQLFPVEETLSLSRGRRSPFPPPKMPAAPRGAPRR